MTLMDLGEYVTFSFLPVHNWNSTGGYMCSYNESGVVHSTDCEGTRYDSCLTAHYCWGPGGCNQSTQLQIAEYLRCMEGSYANTEKLTNSSKRKPCFKEARLDFAPVQQCYENAALSDSIESKLNTSKGFMMASIGANPGTFPHIFVNGAHQANYSWVALTRTLCDLLSSINPAPCHRTNLDLEFALSPAIYDAVAGQKWWEITVGTQVAAAANVATSAAALPAGFAEQDPKYVNVKAIDDLDTKVFPESGRVVVTIEVLAAFVDDAIKGVPLHNSSRFREALASIFQGVGIENATSADISNVTIAKQMYVL